MDLDTITTGLLRRDPARSEATLQADVRQFLLLAPLGLTEVQLETPVGDRRRIDIEVGSTVIEIKKDLRVGNVLSEAESQLSGYVMAREDKYQRRYVGILTDGADWRCYRLKDGAMAEVSRYTLAGPKPDAEALCVWLEGVLATAQDIIPTPLEIERRLGAGTSAHALDRSSLLELYRRHQHDAAVVTKRRLWSKLLYTALGTQFTDDDQLFVEHTLLVNIAEVIAHAVIGFAPQDLVPRSIVSGTQFQAAGVHGVVEADFFDWVVELPGGDTFVRTLARRIARFDWAKVEHDVLKALYESVIEPATRKKLGEYYTPDWLAEHVVETAVTTPLVERVLDPACGSGTFLFHAVRRYLDAAESAGMSLRASLDGVTRHVVGMDLHPVAVTLARVTYLLAIGRDRLTNPSRSAFRVPVFLGDSMQWREKNPTLWSSQALTIPVDDKLDLAPSTFVFPSALLDNAQTFDELIANLADLTTKRKAGAKPPALTGLFRRLAIATAHQAAITSSFETMCRLHDEGRDHIWGYYIRNLARPEWLARPENRADIVVGNPPWLSYRVMSETMQKDFREMSEDRGLWLGAKQAPHQDLAALFAVRMMELYLKDGGKFGLVMPSSVLDGGQHRGFRTGKFGAVQRAELSTAWDLRKLRPHFFPITACVVFGHRRSTATPLPKAREVWSGRLPAGNATWAQVQVGVQRAVSAKKAVSTPRSDYADRFRQGATIVPRVLFLVEKEAAGPLGQVESRVPVRSARSNNEKAPWKTLEAQRGVVEAEFVYRVHLGETVLPYRTLEPKLAVLPLEKNALISESDVLQYYAGLSDWWATVGEAWNKHRKSDRLSLAERLDYHRELTTQFPLQPQRVVYSKSGMHIAAARIEDHRAVIDHKLYWATATSEAEAMFLCAILNAPCVTQMVRPLMSYGKDERDIDKYVWTLPIPLYDPDEPTHAALADLGARAEKEIASITLPETHFAAARRLIREWLADSDIGSSIDQQVSALLGQK